MIIIGTFLVQTPLGAQSGLRTNLITRLLVTFRSKQIKNAVINTGLVRLFSWEWSKVCRVVISKNLKLEVEKLYLKLLTTSGKIKFHFELLTQKWQTLWDHLAVYSHWFTLNWHLSINFIFILSITFGTINLVNTFLQFRFSFCNISDFAVDVSVFHDEVTQLIFTTIFPFLGTETTSFL